MDGYYKKGIKRLGLMTLLGVLLGLRQLKKAGKKIAVRVSPAIKKSVAKADRFVDEKSREVAKKTKEEFAERNNETKENGKQNQTGKTRVTAEEFFGRKKTFNKNFQLPISNDKSSSNDSTSNDGTTTEKVGPSPTDQGPTLDNEIATVASLPRNDNLASGARNFKFSILKPLKSHISCLSSCLEPYVFFILVFIFKRSRQVWKWFEKTEWGVWAIEKLAPWAKFFWLLVKFLGRKFVLLNTAQKVVATMVIFALLWQSGLSAFAQEGDPLEQIITPEMKVLKDVNPELLKADNFEIEKQIEEIQKEKEGEVNYTLGGLIPKTEEDKVVKEEVKILNEIKDGLHGGLLTSSKPVEYTTINFTQSRNPRVKQAALNIRDILKAKGLFRSIYDEETGEEKEISTQIDSGGGKLKPASVPFGAEFSDKFGDGMMISDFGEGGTTVNENFQVPISSDEPISNDQIPNDGTASATSQGPNLTNPVSGTYEATTEKAEPLTETGEARVENGEATASGNFQVPISNDGTTTEKVGPSTPDQGPTLDGIATVASLPRNDSLATSQNPALTSEASENIAKGMDFASKIYKVLIQDGEKLLVDKTPQFQESISFKPLKTNQAHAVYADNKILYKDAWTGVDVLHSVKAEGVKEDIIIKDKSASNKLYFEVKTKGLQMRVKDGGLQFYDIFGNLKFETPRPFMVDRFGNSKDLNYKVIQDKNFIKQVSVEAEPTENTDGNTKAEPLTETRETRVESGASQTASSNFQVPISNDKSSSNDSMSNDGTTTNQGPTLDGTASGTNKPTSFLQKTLNGAKSLALEVKNIFSQIPQLLAEVFWPSKALAGETGEATASGNFQVPMSNDGTTTEKVGPSPTDQGPTLDGIAAVAPLPRNDSSGGSQGPTLDDVTSPTYDKFFTDRELTPRQKKFNEIIKNSSPKNGRENKLSVFDDSVQKAAEALSQSPNWVLSIFSDEQIKLIAGTLEQVLNETGVKGRALNADQGPSLTMSNYSDEMLKDINEERTYVVAIEMDFTGMSYPIDLDPTTYVNLQDRGQVVFHGDYAQGSTYGNQGFMNGYGGMTRSSEPFLPKGSQRGYIPMDSVWTDYSGNGYNLTASGGATFAEGKFSQGGTFDGTDDYAYSTNAGYNVPGLLTISAWFKTTATIGGNGLTVANLGNAAAGQWRRVYLGANNQVCMSGYNVSVACKVTASSINDGAWHHVVAVFGGTASTSHTIYVDNSSQSGTATLNSFGAFQGFFVGTNTDGTDDFNGKIDEVAVWARNLSSAEVAQIYYNGRVENTDPNIVFVDPDGRRTNGRVGTNATALQTNSPWTYYTNASMSNGSQVVFLKGDMNVLGNHRNEKANVEFTFTGTEIWMGMARANYARMVKATVDEGTVNEVVNYIDLYNPNASGILQQKLLIATGLASSSHTVRIYPILTYNASASLAASTDQFHFDFFEYYTSGYELAQKSAITINSRATSGLDFISTKDSPAVSYDARGNIPANASGTQERGTWSSWVKTDFAWNTDNAPHYVWSNENARLYYLYDGSTNGNWYFEMYNGTNWTTVQVKSANYTSGNTFASGDVFHLAVSWDATVGTNLYVNNVKTSYSGSWTAQAMTGNMKVGGDEKAKLLLHGDGPDSDARDIDGSGNGYPLTFNGDAKISTTQSEFGGSSYYFDGTGDYISAPDSEDWNFGSGDFTIDFWARYSEDPNTNTSGFVSQTTDANNRIVTSSVNSGGQTQIGFAAVSGGVILANYYYQETLSTNTWYHFAFVRQGTNVYMFRDGVSKTLTASTPVGSNSFPNLASNVDIGRAYNAAWSELNGYMDEVRVTKGLARWTTNFTPPTGPYHSNMIIAEPTILNYVLTDAEIDAIYDSTVSMGEMLNGTPGSAAIDTQKKLFSAAKRSEEVSQTSKSLLFNYSGVQTADARVGAGAGSLYKTTAPTNPSTTVAEAALTWSGNWTDAGNYRSTTDPNASTVYTTSAAATEIWATYYANTDKGIAEYIIDEGTSKEVRTKVDQYAASATDRYALLATGLENTTHTIKVRWAGTRNLSSTGNYILVGINGTADRIFYYGATPDIATQTMVVNGKVVPNVLVQDYATMPTATNFSPKGNISQSANEGSISVWAQTAWAGNDSTSHYIFESRSAAALSGISLFKNSSNQLTFYWYNATTAANLYGPTLTASNWAPNIPHHVVIKWWRPTSTTVGQAIYLDGVKVAETKSVSLTPNASSLFMLGNATTATSEVNDFDGAIYDFSVWSWAFDDGGASLGAMVSPTSDVGKSYSGYALQTDDDLSSQVDGATNTFKLKEKLERNQPNDATWISAGNRISQTTFGYNMAYDSARSRWYTVSANYIYYSSGPDPEKSTWSSAYTGAAATVNNFSSIYYDSAYDRWLALGTLTGTGEWSAYIWYSSTSDPTTSTWTRKTIAAGSNSESPNDLIYDSANSRWMVVGTIRVEPADTPHYAWMGYSSGADLSTATWSTAYISTASSNQQAYGIAYDSINNYWYVAGYYFTGANTACIWYSTNPTGGVGAWTRTTVESGGTPQASSLIYDSANSRWLVSGWTYTSTYDTSIWYSSGSNLTNTTWTRKDIDTDSEQEYTYDIVKDPNQNKYYLPSGLSGLYGFWPVQISSESSSTLPNSISVKSEGAAATVSSAKAGGMAKLENASGGTLGAADTSIVIDPGTTDSYTKLLLHADGANGDKESIDDSAYQHILTHSGDAKISTTQSKFGGSGYYLDGTGDYITTPDSSDWYLGTGDFTIDTWVYFGDLTNAQIIAGQYVDANNQWYLQKDTNANGNKLKMYFISASAAKGNYVMTNAWSGVAINTWYHLTFVRSTTTGYIFINGVPQTLTATTAFSTNDVGDLASSLWVGGLNSASYVNGYLDELRISKGTARWTADFSGSLPTTPYANTSYDIESNIDTSGGYLTIGRPGSNRTPEVIEYSAYNTSTNTFTISQRGDSSTTATDWPNDTPIEVGGTVTLSAAPASGAKVLATYNYQGDELDRDRGQIKSKSGQNSFLDYTASAATGWALSGDTANKSGRQTITTQVAGQNSFGYFYGAELGYIFSGDTTNGGVAMIVVDEGTGNERRIRSDQNNSATNQFYDQLFSGLSPGYHTFRIISGVDETNSGSNKYGTFDGFVSGTKSDLSLPTTGLSGSEPTSGDTVNDTFYYPAWKDQDDTINTRDSNTKLLLHGDGANNAVVSYDSALPQKYLTHNGDAKISTTQSKFGGSSYSFDGTGDYISAPDSDDWNFGTGSFTIDTWVMFNSLSTVQEIFAQRTDNSNYVTLHYNTDAGIGLRFSIWSGGVNTVSLNQGSLSGWSTGQWYHVAVVRNGNSWNLYRNGTSIASTSTAASSPDFTGSFIIGEYPTGAEYLNGYIDEFRVTKGLARWTGNFTFPDKSYGGFALTADINASVATLVLDSENPSDLSKLGPNGVVKIGSEYIRYESKGVSGNQATLSGLTRGYAQSTAATHSNNDAVYPSGGWRNNYYAQQSSWYRENGAFPEKALIVGTGTEGQVQGGLTIVNLENNSTWGKYDAGASNTIKKAVKTVSAVGGKVLAGYGSGGSGMTELDFGNDIFSSHGSGNDSSTKLLLHGDGTHDSRYLLDSSSSPKTVTSGGVAVYTSQSKFGGSSLYFAGSNYSTLADSDDWYYGTGDFTIDTWVNFSSVSGLRMIYDQGTGVSYYLQLFYSGTSQAFVLDTNTGAGAANITAPFAASANTWYHLAAVRSSGTAYIFVDGKLIKSGTFDKNLDNIGTSLYIGYNPVASSDYFYGYMDDYRISKGVARWTTNFAPAAPYGSLEKTSDIESYFDGTNYNVWASKSKDGTAGSVSGITYLKDSTGSGILNSAYKLDGEYENDYYAKLLLHADGTGATFADSSDPAKTVTANGNATQSATQSEFGGKSAYFDGSGDYLALSDSEDFNFGDGEFTIDGWIYPSGSGSVLLYNGSNVNKFAALYLDSSTSGRVLIDNANAVTGVVLTANTWQHVAVVRSGASLKVYVNGTQSGTTGSVSGTLIGASTGNTIGGNPTYALYFTGYMDEIRISKGIARWTGAFTAPTRAYENFAAKKIEYDSTNNILYADQSSGTANFDIWSKISSPKISSDSTIDSADGADRLSSQTITNDLAQDSTSIYFATDDGVKKVAKSAFSSGVTATFDSSTFSELPTGNDSYAKLLLHADGLNNQNYDHDYSVSKNALTFAGDAKISTTQSKFGGSSYYFDGTGDYISAPDSNDWNFGTGNFTIDIWVRFGDLTNAQIIAGQYVDANNQWYLQKDTNANGNKLKMYFISASAAKGNYVMTNAWSGVAINTWYHLSFVRSSTSGLIFIDGASQSLTETTAFSTNDVGDLASTLQIGGLNLASYVNGYIDEVRFSKGTARWTTGFTPSIEAYHFPAMAVDYSTGASRLASAFRGLVVTSTAAGASPVYYDSTTETSVNRNNELSSSLFSSVSWVDNVASGYTGIAVGGDGGITIANWVSSTGEGGTATRIPKAPGVGFDYGFLMF